MRLELPKISKVDILACPQCKSFYLEENECEACGYKLKLDRLSQPFGSRSLYALKQSYWEAQPWWVRLWPQLESKKSASAKLYVKQLLKRYRALVFSLSEEQKQVGAEGFYIELGDMIIELNAYRVSKQMLLDHKLDKSFPYLDQWIESLWQQGKKPKSTFWSGYTELNVLNRSVLRMILLCLTLLSVSACAGLLAAYYSLY